MKNTIIICDGCQTQECVVSVKIDKGRDPDSSGNGYMTIWDYKDFCIPCLVKYARQSTLPIHKN